MGQLNEYFLLLIEQCMPFVRWALHIFVKKPQPITSFLTLVSVNDCYFYKLIFVLIVYLQKLKFLFLIWGFRIPGNKYSCKQKKFNELA